MHGVILDEQSLFPSDLDLSSIFSQLNSWDRFGQTKPDDTLARLKNTDIVLTNKVVLNQEIIKSCPQLKYIGVTATGTNNVDIKAAHEAGIVVCNATNYSTQAVAQHTFALILSLSQQLNAYYNDVKSGTWCDSPLFCRLDYPQQTLKERELVIVGYGAIGKAVARIAEAFEMKVSIAARPGFENSDPRSPLKELLLNADVVSLHCPLTPDTYQLIDSQAISTMKNTALLINCARGDLVDEQALATALTTKQIGGAGLDVLSIEPPPSDHPLLNIAAPNLIITPHCAWGSREARQQLVNIVAENIRLFLTGQPQNQVGLL